MRHQSAELGAAADPSQEPWQLKIFRRTLKKQQKLQALRRVLPNVSGKECLLITHGDNNGALNWHLRTLGGTWSWADFEHSSAKQIEQLLGDPVEHWSRAWDDPPFPPSRFDLVITIDVHEHLEAHRPLNEALFEIAKPGGHIVITTPNGDSSKLAVRLKNLIGMTPEVYGHKVWGFTQLELEAQLGEVGLEPYLATTYSGFFTEMLELAINFLYVKVLASENGRGANSGQIAPQTKDEVQSVGMSVRLYTWIFPFLRLIASLDRLLATQDGHAVVVAARKQSA